MNFKPTSAIIRDAAQVFREKAQKLDQMADALESTKDWSIAGEAISTITSLSNIRLDLLVLRPTRELERELDRVNPTPQHGDEE